MQHALLSASSASRWLNCTAAPRFEEQFPESSTDYAEEGRLAHEMCELKVLRTFTNQLTPRAYTTRLNKLKKNPLHTPEMDRATDLYVEHLQEQAMLYPSPPNVAAEVRVELDAYIPESFGTCDCIMIGGDTLSITDFKYGRGVPVAAENNPQMRFYALGALRRYNAVYGDTIKRVRMTIDQPRIREEVSTETITVDELIAWGQSVQPIAQKAFIGAGTFNPGEHCRFCRGKAQCRARAEQNTALEEFKAFAIPKDASEPISSGNNMLTDAEIGELLTRGKDLVKWYSDLEEYALTASLAGRNISGYKAVEGRSNRAFSDPDAAIAAVLAAGYDEALIFDRKAKTLSELEKLMGKADFEKTLGSYVVKPAGKPTLVPDSDKRPAYNRAATDFAEVTA